MIHNRRMPQLMLKARRRFQSSGLGAAAAPAFAPRNLTTVQPAAPVFVSRAADPAIAATRAQAMQQQQLTPRPETFSGRRLDRDPQKFDAESQAGAAERLAEAKREWAMRSLPTDVAIEVEDMNDTAKARAAFMTWLKQSFPETYSQALAVASGGQLGDTNASSFDWSKFIDAATAAATAVFTTRAQKDMLKVNIERAKAGLPPVDTSFAAPVVRTQIDVSPEIAAQLQQQAQAGMRNILLFGGIGLAAFLLLRR